ncbi:MAG: thermonuclease family protein [Rhodocyclaceae bacterium]|nr:thermonuclease family protein [Rhodocyclaceae bacterium]
MHRAPLLLIKCLFRERLLQGALLFVAASIALAQSTPQRCRAVDGDTLRCGGERIRLMGIYAPERAEAGGSEARQRLQALINSGRVHMETAGRDKYGRVLAYVYVDGRRLVQERRPPKNQ